MNRRSFLHAATLAASALAIDPERLLWTPGQKTIFVPKPIFAPIPLKDALAIGWG